MRDDEMKGRVRLVQVHECDLLTVFGRAVQNDHDVLSLPQFNLPEGFAVEAVHYDYAYRAFFFRVFHESFEPVPEGQRIPVIGGGFDVKRTQYSRQVPADALVLQITREVPTYATGVFEDFVNTPGTHPPFFSTVAMPKANPKPKKWEFLGAP